MYLIRSMTNLSLDDIGREFGNRDHSTVIHSLDKVEEQMKKSPTFAETVKEIKTNINSRVMVPLRALGEKLGFTVTWKDGEAKLENKDIYTVVRPGDDVYFITTSHKDMVGMSAPISFGAVPYVSNGTTYVSLDFFKTLMDYQNGSITLDGSTIQINTGK